MADYYTPGTPATANTLARAENIAAELVTIKASFDKIPEQLSLEQDRAAFATDTGVADAYVVALPATLLAYTTGLAIRVKIVNANTGASTINVDGLGVKSIKRFDGAALAAGDMPAGAVLELYYDGTNFQLGGGPATITNAVIGPGSSTDEAVMRFNGTTGKAAQNSGDTLDDNNIYTHAAQTRWKKGADIASASPLVIGTDGNMFDVTGTTGFSAMTVAAGTLFMLQFDGAVTMTHGAGTLDLPWGENITTATGGMALCFATAANVVRVLSYITATQAQMLTLLGAQATLAIPSQAEAEAGTATTGRRWTAQRVKQAIAALETLPRSYLTGLTLSNGTDATNDINIAVGEARSGANDANLVVGTAIGKRIDANWVAGGTTGTPTGGISSSLTLTDNTWYHIILGLVSGTAEVGFDTSITGANLFTDHSFTNTRRIGSVRRGSATNLAFSQVGDEFLWDDPPLDVNVANPGTSAATRTLTVPPDVVVWAITNLNANNESATAAGPFYISSLDVNDEAPSFSAAPSPSVGSSTNADEDTAVGGVNIRTNTSSQVRTRAVGSSTNTAMRVTTLGWFDRRGRDD